MKFLIKRIIFFSSGSSRRLQSPQALLQMSYFSAEEDAIFSRRAREEGVMQ